MNQIGKKYASKRVEYQFNWHVHHLIVKEYNMKFIIGILDSLSRATSASRAASCGDLKLAHRIMLQK